MKLSIIPSDNSVAKNEVGIVGLDLSTCSIPENVWALQWDETKGHIEYPGQVVNTEINELPNWAEAAKDLWETAKVQLDAEEEEREMAKNAGKDDPALDAIMAEYPTVTQVYAEAVIAKLNSSGFNLEVVSGNFAYSNDVQLTRPFKPIGIACVNLAGSGTAILNKMSEFAVEAAKYGIPIFAYHNTLESKDKLTKYNIEHMGQTEYVYDGWPLMYTKWTLEKEKTKKDKDINLDRANALDAGFEWEGNRFDADNLSRTNLAGYVAMVDANINLPANFTWRDINNNDIVLTNETIKDFATAMNTFVNDTYVASWERKADVQAATTIDAVRAI